MEPLEVCSGLGAGEADGARSQLEELTEVVPFFHGVGDLDEDLGMKKEKRRIGKDIERWSVKTHRSRRLQSPRSNHGRACGPDTMT
jgi:hypothetical protein